MKTAEEKAKEYADIIDPVIVSGTNITRTIDELNEFAQMDYLAGYLKAIMWRDPKEELPENGEPVIVKYMTARGIKKYGIGKYFELGIGNPWTIEGSTGREVIGWRPIE